jgi:hypothetical protein
MHFFLKLVNGNKGWQYASIWISFGARKNQMKIMQYVSFHSAETRNRGIYTNESLRANAPTKKFG